MGLLTDFFNRRSTDNRLLAGELSAETGEGRKRAKQLVSRRHRAHSARALRELVTESTRRSPSLLNANLPIQARAVWENAELILALAQELEESPAVDPRGVILTDRLLTDGASPAYAPEDHGELARAVDRAREALKPG